MKAPPSRAWAVLAIAALMVLGNYLYNSSFYAIFPNRGSELARAFGILSYASVVGAMLGGIVVWLAGARWGVLGGLVLWTLVAILGTVPSDVNLVIAARAVQALAAPFLFFGGLQAIAEWFPRGFHGLGVGLLRVVGVAGGLLMPSLVPIRDQTGWPVAGVAIAIWGVVLALLWVAVTGPRRGEPAADFGASGEAALRSPVSWALIAGLLIAAPLQAFLFSRLPMVTARQFGIANITPIPMAVSAVVLVAIALFSDLAIQSGRSAGASRGTAALIAGGMMLTVVLLPFCRNPVPAIAIVAIVYAGYQSWIVILYSALLDAIPAGGAGLVAGMAGFLAGFAGIVIGPIFPRLAGSMGFETMAIVMGGIVLLALPMAALVWQIPGEDKGLG